MSDLPVEPVAETEVNTTAAPLVTPTLVNLSSLLPEYLEQLSKNIDAVINIDSLYLRV